MQQRWIDSGNQNVQQKKAVNHVSFSIGQGEVVAALGKMGRVRLQPFQ